MQRKEKDMTIKMRDFGRSLVTRSAGRLAYDAISPAVASATERVVLDFEGVDVITNSFADEVFGHLVLDMGMDELRARTTFRGVQPFFAQVVRTAMDSRESQREIPAVC